MTLFEALWDTGASSATQVVTGVVREESHWRKKCVDPRSLNGIVSLSLFILRARETIKNVDQE